MRRPAAFALIALLFLAFPSFAPAEETAKPAAAGVLICGTGISPQFDRIVGRLSEFLDGKNVAVKMAAGNDLDLTRCLAKTAERGAASLLFVVANATEENQLSVFGRCVTADGRRLWEEQVSGPLVTSSLEDAIAKSTAELLEKIEPHIGAEGLPTR